MIKSQICFVQEFRNLIREGLFYRLLSPFEGNDSAWMVIDKNKQEALVGYYQIFGIPNGPWKRLYLVGLDENKQYIINSKEDMVYGGDELMNAGLIIHKDSLCANGGDYSSQLYHLKAVTNK